MMRAGDGERILNETRECSIKHPCSQLKGTYVAYVGDVRIVITLTWLALFALRLKFLLATRLDCRNIKIFFMGSLFCFIICMFL